MLLKSSLSDHHGTSTTKLSESSARLFTQMRRFCHISQYAGADTNDIIYGATVPALANTLDNESRSDRLANIKRKGTPTAEFKPVIPEDRKKCRIKRSKFRNSLSPNWQDHPKLTMYNSEWSLNPSAPSCNDDESPSTMVFGPRRRSMSAEMLQAPKGFISRQRRSPAPWGCMTDVEADSDSYDSRSTSVVTVDDMHQSCQSLDGLTSGSSSSGFTPSLFDNMHLSPSSAISPIYFFEDGPRSLTIEEESSDDPNVRPVSDKIDVMRKKSTSSTSSRDRSASFCEDHEANFKMQFLASAQFGSSMVTESGTMPRKSSFAPTTPVQGCLSLGSVLSPPGSCGLPPSLPMATFAETGEDISDGSKIHRSGNVFNTISESARAKSTSPGTCPVRPCYISSLSLEDGERCVATAERPQSTELSWREDVDESHVHESLQYCTRGDLDDDMVITTVTGIVDVFANDKALGSLVPNGVGNDAAPVETPLKTQTCATRLSYAPGMFSTPQSTTTYYGCNESTAGWKESAPATEFDLQIFCQILASRAAQSNSHEAMHCGS